MSYYRVGTFHTITSGKRKFSKVLIVGELEFYVACIRSILTYGCQVYHNALPEYLSLSLERIQKGLCV